MLIVNGMERLKDGEYYEGELNLLQTMIDLYHSLDEVKALGDRLNISEYKNASSFSLDNGKELVRIDMGIPNLMTDNLLEPIYIYKGNHIYLYLFDISKKKVVSKETFDNCNDFCLKENRGNGYYQYFIKNIDDHLNIEIRFKDNNFDKSILTEFLNGDNDLYELHSVLPKEDLVIKYTTPLNTETFIYQNNLLVDDIKEGIFPEETGLTNGDKPSQER